MLAYEISELEAKRMYPHQRELQENYTIEELIHAIDYNKLSQLPVERIHGLNANVQRVLKEKLEADRTSLKLNYYGN